MRILRVVVTTFLVGVLLVPARIAHGQEITAADGTRIAGAEVSGLPIDQLSPGLRKEITSLAGASLSRQTLRDLAARIEAEQPGTVAAVRSVDQPGGGVRVVFLVARISERVDLQENINARYVVESVEISGIDESVVRDDVRGELKALVGKPLDPDEAERLQNRLDLSLPNHDVTRRIERGTQPGQVKVIFDVADAVRPWIPFTTARSKLVYHAYQGWSGALDIPFTSGHHRFVLGGAIENEDDLVEQYSGWHFKVESRKLGTDRLGASLEFSTLRQSWREATLQAIDAAGLPVAYRARRTIEPLVTFAFSPSIRVTGGVSVSELESLSQSPDSEMASALVAGVEFNHQWSEAGGTQQNVAGGYGLRRASEGFNSDLEYTRNVARFSYGFRRQRNTVFSQFAIGRTSGAPPMFERFTLGDTATLRGWNKYDIAPAGATRMFHHTLEYRHRILGVFLDSGAVWNEGEDVRPRFSTGVGLHGRSMFMTIGVPLNADDVRPTFMIGFRSSLELSF